MRIFSILLLLWCTEIGRPRLQGSEFDPSLRLLAGKGGENAVIGRGMFSAP